MKTKKDILRFAFIVGITFFIVLVGTTENISAHTLGSISTTTEFKPYKFIAFGDTRKKGDDNSGLELCVKLIEELMKEHTIDFILHTGDLVEEGGDQNEYDTYFWPVISNLSQAVQIYYAVGNHEYNRPGEFDVDLVTFKANVNNPGNEVYYSFDSPQNDTHFIVLNTDYWFNDKNPTRQAEQQAWLEADIEANYIERIVVMHHRPFWGVNPDRVTSEYEFLRPIWHDFFVESGVDLVFNGHDHHFYHTVRNGTHYTVTGGGTAALYTPQPNNPKIQKTWQADDFTFKDNHVCLVEVTEAGFEIDVIIANGTTVYEYNVTASTDLYPPTIDSPDDIVMNEGTTGNAINWTAIDAHPGQFSVYQDGVVVDGGTWTNGTPIVYVLDELKEGEYNLTIILTDKIGHASKDTVDVRVNPITTTKATSGFSGLEILLLLPAIFLYRKKQ